MSDGDERGKFLHTTPDGETRLIDIPNQYRDLSLETAHGHPEDPRRGESTIADGEGDSYVITEDHYIDYLTRTELANLVPVTLAAKLRKSHFLFLGYGLRDWNMRVILHRIAGEQRLTYKSWAIQRQPTDLDQKVLGPARCRHPRRRSRARYIAALRGRLRLTPAEAASVRECPYAGLMPFTEEQAPFFFGRDAEREIITANLMARA